MIIVNDNDHVRIICLYIGQVVERRHYTENDVLERIFSTETKRLNSGNLHSTLNKCSEWSILLKPLNKISDDDAFKVAEIIYGNLDYEIEFIKKRYISEIIGDIKDDFGTVQSKPIKPYFSCVWQIADFLRKEGYALPYGPYTVKQLEEAGIYKLI